MLTVKQVQQAIAEGKYIRIVYKFSTYVGLPKEVTYSTIRMSFVMNHSDIWFNAQDYFALTTPDTKSEIITDSEFYNWVFENVRVEI